MKLLADDALCPCGRLGEWDQPARFDQCCGRWLQASTPAPDAQALMRSRYSAFVLEHSAYLLQTWHASTRPAQLNFEAGVKWLGLQVHAYQVIDATHAQVEFVARQRSVNGRATRLHECSEFVQEAGVWYYVGVASTPMACEIGRRLALLGGTEPALKTPPRRRL